MGQEKKSMRILKWKWEREIEVRESVDYHTMEIVENIVYSFAVHHGPVKDKICDIG